jgi:hypothetical protein
LLDRQATDLFHDLLQFLHRRTNASLACNRFSNQSAENTKKSRENILFSYFGLILDDFRDISESLIESNSVKEVRTALRVRPSRRRNPTLLKGSQTHWLRK